MFSKSLFKQSCKANGVMWAIITFATCFMLACVMLIAGGGNLVETKEAIQDTIIQGELTSQTEKRAIADYLVAEDGLEKFDGYFVEEYKKAALSGSANAAETAYTVAAGRLTEYLKTVAEEKGYAADSTEAQEITGVVFYLLNPAHGFDEFYRTLGEEAPVYEMTGLLFGSATQRAAYRNEYAAKYAPVFLSGNMIKEENVNAMLEALKSYNVSKEDYSRFGFDDYASVKDISVSALVEFRARLENRLENMKEGETPEGIAAELTGEISKSLLATLPQEVSEALEEIGQMDMYGTLVGSVFFKMAGLLLPIIYMIMASNALIAGQVDSGSMAYVLSSSVKRRTVTFTQAVFLVGSLFLMFCCTSVTGVVCLSLVELETSLTYGKLLLLNLGAFLTMFAMSGICFLSSCWFNRSKNSMALGGGLNMFFLVATMLGLFGSPVLPSIIRMEALNSFNYVSLISLFDAVAILNGGLGYLWKFAVLLVIGLVCYFVGSEKFAKKDLPL